MQTNNTLSNSLLDQKYAKIESSTSESGIFEYGEDIYDFEALFEFNFEKPTASNHWISSGRWFGEHGQTT
eukprot:UN15955